MTTEFTRHNSSLMLSETDGGMVRALFASTSTVQFPVRAGRLDVDAYVNDVKTLRGVYDKDTGRAERFGRFEDVAGADNVATFQVKVSGEAPTRRYLVVEASFGEGFSEHAIHEAYQGIKAFHSRQGLDVRSAPLRVRFYDKG